MERSQKALVLIVVAAAALTVGWVALKAADERRHARLDGVMAGALLAQRTERAKDAAAAVEPPAPQLAATGEQAPVTVPPVPAEPAAASRPRPRDGKTTVPRPAARMPKPEAARLQPRKPAVAATRGADECAKAARPRPDCKRPPGRPAARQPGATEPRRAPPTR